MHPLMISPLGQMLVRVAALSPLCRTISADFSAAADNVAFAETPNPHNATANYDFLIRSFANGAPVNGTRKTTGTFTIKATYCQPQRTARNRRIVQLMVYGTTYTRAL